MGRHLGGQTLRVMTCLEARGTQGRNTFLVSQAFENVLSEVEEIDVASCKAAMAEMWPGVSKQSQVGCIYPKGMKAD